MMDILWWVLYAACGLVSFRVCLRWLRKDLATIGPLDDDDRQFLAIYGFLFCCLVWPIGFPVVAGMTHHFGPRQAAGLLTRVGSWGERHDDRGSKSHD